MPDNRGAVIAWSAGVSVVAATFAGILASRARTPLSSNAWFIACVVVACVALAILLLAGLSLLVSWWPSRRGSQAKPEGVVLPRVRDFADRALLGIHPAIPLSNSEPTLSRDLPVYISRDIDTDLDQWVANHRASGGFLLLVGPAAAGKTRTAYELVRRTTGDWQLFMPASSAQFAEFMERSNDPGGLVVWLNEVQNFLGPGGLTSGSVRRMLAGDRPVITVATIWPDRYEALTKPSPSDGVDDPNKDAREILGMLADRKDLLAEFTAAERQRARDLADRDPRIAEVLLHSDRADLAAMLAATPELVRRWVAATSQYGAAVISAAVFARLCGHPEVVPDGVLESLVDCFLTGEQRARLTSESWYSEAVEWAQQPVRGNVAPLIPQSKLIGRLDGYMISDVLVQYATRDQRITSQLGAESAWLRLIASASPDACILIARAALLRYGLGDVFAQATLKSANDGDIMSMYNMGALLTDRGETAEADAWFAKATATGDPMALTAVAATFRHRGDKSEAETLLRKAADAGFPRAMIDLSDLLRDEANTAEAESWLRLAVAKGYPPAMSELGMLLHFRGEDSEAEEWTRRAAEAGNLQGIAFLGVLLSQSGRKEDAETWLRKAARFGHPIAMTELGSLLLGRGDATEAQEWWRRSASAGEYRAMAYLGAQLKERGQEAEAERLWRQAADGGNPMGAHNLGVLFYERGDNAEAQRWLREATDSGFVESMALLAVVAKESGNDSESQMWWRAAAEKGNVAAMTVLAAELEEAGDTAEAEEWWSKAADAGDISAMILLASRLQTRHEIDGAERLLQTAADAGSASAAVNLGMLLLYERDENQEAAKLFRRAAEMGSIDGMSNLGLVLQESGDEPQAEFWMRKAVDAGHSGAMANLGAWLFKRGQTAEAESLLRRSAHLGHPRGMYNFGELLHQRGLNEEAETWRQKSVAMEPGRDWPPYEN